MTSKPFEFVERSGVFEDLGIQFDRLRGRINTRAAAVALFGMARVGCRISP